MCKNIFYKRQKQRLILLTGAGLTQGKDFFDISTLSLTNQFVEYTHPDLADDSDLIRFIYSEYCFWNKLNPSDVEKNINKINFETILHIVEELFSYIEDVDKTNHKSKHLNNVKTSIFRLNARLIEYIFRVKSPKWKDFTYLFIEKIHNHLIDILIESIEDKNCDKNNRGMNDFNRFIDSIFSKSSNTRRLYTLNYDTWFPNFAGYFDGFTENRFNRSKVIQDRDVDCHYNLHGCILWNYGKVYDKLDKPEKRKHFQSSSEYTIAREAILPSPIISGYNKLSRINSSPFLEIWHSFTSDCFSGNIVIIIGYSFSDPHVNNNLRLVNSTSKVVIVVKFSQAELNKVESSFTKIKYEVEDIFGCLFSEIRIRSGLNYTIDSDDGRVSFFIDGIGNSFYQEYSYI